MSADRDDPRAGPELPEQSQGTLSYWGPAIAVSLSMFIAVIDSTLMNVAVPAIVSDLETTVPVVQGAIALYSLVMAALMLPGGKLPSIYGVRRLMQGTLVVYAAGTLLAALSWSPWVLYLGWSVIEGAAAAVLMPLTFTVLVVTYDGKDRATALGLLAGVNAAGAAVGPIVGGALTTFASWRWGSPSKPSSSVSHWCSSATSAQRRWGRSEAPSTSAGPPCLWWVRRRSSSASSWLGSSAGWSRPDRSSPSASSSIPSERRRQSG